MYLLVGNTQLLMYTNAIALHVQYASTNQKMLNLFTIYQMYLKLGRTTGHFDITSSKSRAYTVQIQWSFFPTLHCRALSFLKWISYLWPLYSVKGPFWARISFSIRAPRKTADFHAEDAEDAEAEEAEEAYFLKTLKDLGPEPSTWAPNWAPGPWTKP